MVFVLFFFFKQKTAYEMRISDWSSDVCSSDLEAAPATALAGGGIRACYPSDHVLQGRLPVRRPGRGVPLLAMLLAVTAWPASTPLAAEGQQQQARGEAAIHNQAQLDDYLRRHVASGEPTPLDAFSDGARERFLSDLVWGSDGLGGFNRGDLAEELDDDQIHAVLEIGRAHV